MTAPIDQRRVVSLVQWLTVGSTILALVLLFVAVPFILDSSAGIDAQNRSDEITACRSEYRAPIDQSDARLEEANTALGERKTELERVQGAQAETFNAGLVAAVQGNDAQLAELVTRYPGEVEAIRAERAKVTAAQGQVRIAQDDKTAAADAYSKAVRLSRTDPARFLEDCRRLTR